MENPMKPKEKIGAMKKFKRAQFLYNLVLYSLTTLITFLFVSYTFWLPSTKHFFLVSLPDGLSGFFDAKCFFVLANIIVFILVRESRQASPSSRLSIASDVYDEYVARSKGFREVKSEMIEELGLNLEEKKIGNHGKKQGRDGKVVKRMRKVGNVDGKIAFDMPKEELNKRVEAFIQRVNRQRSLEN